MIGATQETVTMWFRGKPLAIPVTRPLAVEAFDGAPPASRRAGVRVALVNDPALGLVLEVGDGAGEDVVATRPGEAQTLPHHRFRRSDRCPPASRIEEP